MAQIFSSCTNVGNSDKAHNGLLHLTVPDEALITSQGNTQCQNVPMTTESAHPNIKADLQQLHVGLSSPLADMAALWSASTETEGKGASRTARGQLTLTLHKDLPSGELTRPVTSNGSCS